MDRFVLHNDTKIYLEKLLSQLTAPIQAVADAWKATSATILDGFAKQQQQLDALTASTQAQALEIQSLNDKLSAGTSTGSGGEVAPDPADVATLADLAGSIGGFTLPVPPTS